MKDLLSISSRYISLYLEIPLQWGTDGSPSIIINLHKSSYLRSFTATPILGNNKIGRDAILKSGKCILDKKDPIFTRYSLLPFACPFHNPHMGDIKDENGLRLMFLKYDISV